MLIILYYLQKFDEANKILKKLLMANITNPTYIHMTNYNIKYFIPHIDKNDWEFYGKFQRYSKKFLVPEELKKEVDKLFTE